MRVSIEFICLRTEPSGELALVNTVMNFCVSIKDGEFFDEFCSY
jgi:hypothetical protein